MKTEIATEFHDVPAGQEVMSSGEEDLMMQCPTCNKKIKCADMAEHCRVEMERLQEETASTSRPTRKREESTPANSYASGTAISRNGASGSGHNEERRKPWSVFQRIQRNRQARQKQRTRKRATTPTPLVEFSCPVCNKNFPQSKIQRHANQCIRRSKSIGATSATRLDSSDEDIDSEEYEEYEWAGQKRIRISTMVPGGYATLGIGQTIKHNGNQQLTSNSDANEEDEEEDLNVDEDDTHIYGPAQYSEADVIPLASDDSDDPGGTGGNTSYMRRLIASSDICHGAQTNEEKKPQQLAQTAILHTTVIAETSTESLEFLRYDHEGASTSSTLASLFTKQSNKLTSKNAAPSQQIIESLKAKLRLYESQIQNKYKCLICIDDYKNPAISVSCWHVYCEQCWLRTLGARKLCPQCNSITTPKDLRRIYL